MGSIGAPEILVILVIALLVLGPERLPEVARKVGKVVAEVRRMSSGFQSELRDAMNLDDEPAAASPPPEAATGSTNGSAPKRYLWSDLPLSSGSLPSAGQE